MKGIFDWVSNPRQGWVGMDKRTSYVILFNLDDELI